MPTEKTTEPSTTGIVISFIVPAYNEEAELPGTLRAIRSAAVGYEHEIVLVNDGSTDATGAIGEKFGARVISIERRQIAAARNAGAAAARGNVFIFVDADTRIGPEHVRGAVEALERGCAGGGAAAGELIVKFRSGAESFSAFLLRCISDSTSAPARFSLPRARIFLQSAASTRFTSPAKKSFSPSR